MIIIDINELLIVNESTGELLTAEKVAEEYIKLKNLTIHRKKESVDQLMIKLDECADDLTKEDILRIAKRLDHPINSFYKFYMVSLSPYYMDLDMSKGASTLLNKMLKMVVNGHLVDRHLNNKPIKTLKSLYATLDVSKSTFQRARLELEKLRLIKCLDGNDTFSVLFNPIYIRCGNMNEFTLYEFENGSKDMDRIEFLELTELVNLKRTEIIKWKIEFEKRINEMEFIDLYYLNVRV